MSSTEFNRGGVTYTHEPTGGYHRLFAHLGGEKIGHLEWDADKITHVEVYYAEHSGTGVATNLLLHARRLAKEGRAPYPNHSDNLSSSGKDWHKSLARRGLLDY